MIRKLLIANRGEIALRVIRACRELGVQSVAVYSDADRRAVHVAAADAAQPVGPAPAAASYLSIPSLMEAARRSGADAVHPGYGFLSERPALAAACERAGLTFVGPPAAVIARLGSKIESRRMMEQAGVPIVPGETPPDQSDAGVARAAAAVGLPVLVKASAGGGGKGMRRVSDPSALVEAIQGARREALAVVGDGTLYVERLIDRPRHVEVQIVADHHGGITHLFERECSVQRRHQKVIEESPSPALTPALRERLTVAAVRAAAAAGYRNAGTVEFLLDEQSRVGDEPSFYFLEMNTRLQVEHPVTEVVTGVDLVAAQIRLAAGERLPWTARDLRQRGHAIEARVYAEDPARGFLPQAGTILLCREPAAPGVRVDSGVADGSEVPVHYDALLAKVIAGGETREAARRRLVEALGRYLILGVRTNIPFLIRVLEHPQFRAGELDTAFLDRESDALAAAVEAEWPAPVRAALAAYEADQTQTVLASAADPWTRLDGWRG